MGLRVAFELDDDDLRHFQLIMREARKVAARMAPEDIVAAAEAQLRDVLDTSTPGFILERIGKLHAALATLASTPSDAAARESATREIHTLKGEARMLRLERTGELAASIEGVLLRVSDGDYRALPDVQPELESALSVLLELIREESSGARVGVDVAGLSQRLAALP